MELSELVSGWNGIFEFKIKETNLTKPDQEFLTNALLAYLEKLNVDIRPLVLARRSDNSAERLRFKLGLRCAINDIYKNVTSAAAPDNEFYYMDLLQPAPKKTTELLRFLFNYLLFHNQLQNEISMEDKIKERDEKIKIKKKLQTDHEKKRCEAESIENRIKELQEILLKFREKNSALEKKHSRLRKSARDLEESLVEIDLKLISLKQKNNELMEKIIPEEELEKKLSIKSSLKDSVQEALEIAEVEIEKNNGCKLNIENLQEFVKEIGGIVQLLPSEDSLKKQRSLVAQCNDLSTKITDQAADNNRINNLISENKNLLNKINKKRNDFQKKIKSEKLNLESKIKQADRRMTIAMNLIEELDERLHKIEESVEEQERIKKGIDRATVEFGRFLNIE